jgi:hypothetical protein
VRMERSEAEKELSRIEGELDAQSPIPAPRNGKATTHNADTSTKHDHLDVVIVGAVVLTAIGLITVVGESLSPKQKTQLSAGAIGGACGLLVGYGIGRAKR